MDERDKKIKELEDANKAKDAEIATLKTTVEQKDKDIATKDALIEQKTQDIIGARRETQKLKELTDEEKAKLSEKEIQLHNATLQLQKDTEAFQKTQAEAAQKEVGARRAAAIKKIAGADPELAKKIEENVGKIVGADKATTEEEVAGIVTQAFNMLGVAKPDPIRNAVNGEGASFEGSGDAKGFAESQAGKDLASTLGLPAVEAPKTE